MPRGFKLAIEATAQARAEGRLRDKRSFLGFKPDNPAELHQLLYGEDKSRVREEVCENAKGFCQGCATPHYVGWNGEWDHIKGGNSDRCDCVSNGRWVCREFHRTRHVQVRLNESNS